LIRCCILLDFLCELYFNTFDFEDPNISDLLILPLSSIWWLWMVTDLSMPINKTQIVTIMFIYLFICSPVVFIRPKIKNGHSMTLIMRIWMRKHIEVSFLYESLPLAMTRFQVKGRQQCSVNTRNGPHGGGTALAATGGRQLLKRNELFQIYVPRLRHVSLINNFEK